MAAGVGQLEDEETTRKNCKIIAENRDFLTSELRSLGFDVTDSKTNFVFAKSDKIGGADLYFALRERGILVRHFTAEKIADYNRITVGTQDQVDALLGAIKDILS